MPIIFEHESRQGVKNPNRDAAQAFYETTNMNFAEIAKKIGVAPGTVKSWVQKYGWERQKAVENVEVEVLHDDLANQAIYSILGAKKEEIKDRIRTNLGGLEVDPIVLETLLDNTSDELLLKAMNLHFMHKNMFAAAVMANDELKKMKMQSLSKNTSNPMLIAAAEKVVNIFDKLKTSLYGKDSTLSNTPVCNDYSQMTTDELLRIASETEGDKGDKEG